MRAERCQNFAIKVISDGHYKKRDSVTPPRKSFSLPTFQKLCELRFACHIYKIVYKIFSHWYFQFPLLNETSDRNTSSIHVPCPFNVSQQFRAYNEVVKDGTNNFTCKSNNIKVIKVPKYSKNNLINNKVNFLPSKIIDEQ